MANYPEELERLSFSAQQKEILTRRLLAGGSAAARPGPRRDRAGTGGPRGPTGPLSPPWRRSRC